MIEKVAHLIFTEEVYQVRGTVLVFSDPWKSIGDTDRALLDKILQAVKLTIHDVAIVHQPALDLGALTPRPRRVVYFGDGVKGLTPFEVIEAEGTSLIISTTLSQLQTDTASKAKLWSALKVLFSR
jgi:DNA polymerase III psi subunit